MDFFQLQKAWCLIGDLSKFSKLRPRKLRVEKIRYMKEGWDKLLGQSAIPLICNIYALMDILKYESFCPRSKRGEGKNDILLTVMLIRMTNLNCSS